MNKTELIAAIANKTGDSKVVVGRMLDGLAATVREQIQTGHAVNLAGFVKFEPHDRAARTGRNPKTGAAIEIPAKRIAKAKVSDSLLGAQ